MCGIIAHVGGDDVVDELVTGLERLEYRGYDSAGVALQNGSGIAVRKRSGEVSALKQAIDRQSLGGSVGIGHTRWSTHGPPTDANAHPHTDSTDTVAVVHNGVIENYAELKDALQSRGHTFTSETDTEVIPHLVAHYLDGADDPRAAFHRAVDDLEGSYAIAALVDGVDAVYAARRGSPLVIGLDGDDLYVASDAPAFLNHTDRVVYLEDGDTAVLEPGDYTVADEDGEPVSREIETLDWNADQIGKGTFDHFMLKEITKQPTALENTTRGRIDADGRDVDLSEFPPGTFEGIDRVQFVACGTSYHAALYGRHLLNESGIPAQAYRASEYGTADPIDEETLVLAVSQSGETADTLSALDRANAAGARTLALTNVMGSTAARVADDALFIRAGPEIGVAATKTFSSQIVALSLLVHRVADDVTGTLPWQSPVDYFDALRRLPQGVERVVDDGSAADVADRFLGSEAFFFIGRGLGYPVAVEGALKFKEITYEHAEGFSAGELKHGPLALVTPQTPIFAVFTGVDDEKTVTNVKEAQSRGAPIVAVAEAGHQATDIADAHLEIPDTHPVLAGLLANVQLQLVSYHTARLLGRPIDKPRNLAKSVTVE